MKPTSRTSLSQVADHLANELAPLENGREGEQQAVDIAGEFFAFSDAVASSDQLRQVLSDPDAPVSAKQETVDRLLSNKANPIVLSALKEMAGAKWGDADDFGLAVEQLGREALLTAAAKDGKLEDVEQELFDLVHNLSSYPDAVGFLSDPATAPARRGELMRNLLSHTAHPITEKLAARAALGRGAYVEKLQGVGDQIAKRRRLTIAKVTSVVELTPEQTNRLERVLSRKYGKSIEVVTTIDPAIMGGLRIEIGPYLIDDTVATHLADATRKLAAKPSG